MNLLMLQMSALIVNSEIPNCELPTQRHFVPHFSSRGVGKGCQVNYLGTHVSSRSSELNFVVIQFCVRFPIEGFQYE